MKENKKGEISHCAPAGRIGGHVCMLVTHKGVRTNLVFGPDLAIFCLSRNVKPE